MQRYDEAFDDSSKALQLDQTNVKNYLRKGLSAYYLGKKEEALKLFNDGLEIDPEQHQLKIWKEKCEQEKSSDEKSHNDDKNKSSSITTDVPSVVVPPAKIKHTFYQSDSTVYIQIPIKNLKKEQVEVHTSETTLSVSAKLPSGNDYSLEIDLAYPINHTRTDFKVTSTNIEIKLSKKDAIQWTALDAAQTKHGQPPIQMNRPVSEHTPTYPSSSKKPKDWDKLAVELKNEEKEEKPEGDAAVNQLFQQIYRDGSDETKRAMNKSFSESGGTVLSTNWDEIGKAKTELKAPEGMEWKKYDT